MMLASMLPDAVLLGRLAILAGLLPACALLAGYLLSLYVHREPPLPEQASHPTPRLPTVDIVVPVRNEAGWIEEKIRNLTALRYPKGLLKIWIVDGDSDDGTAMTAARHTSEGFVEVIRVPVADKILQLNAGFARAHGEWILVTDADARLHPDTLGTLVARAAGCDDVAVIGTSVEPALAHPLERLHWQLTNRVRKEECSRAGASIVAAPCYLFRRSLLGQFPPDVVADDVHVAFVAAAAGKRVAFVEANVLELRSPLRLGELFHHKRRKADAYLREILRFLPERRRMLPPARRLFVWRAAQMFLTPGLVVFGGAALLSSVSSGGLPHLPHLSSGSSWLLIAPLGWMARRYLVVLAQALALASLLLLVLLAAQAAYPFSRQTASYPKVGTPLRRRGWTVAS
ncbi:MAG: glycosyltransferase [Acidobacteria bacterium]|nr:glycosyltransferase [Acidobacteriota bacterium]